MDVHRQCEQSGADQRRAASRQFIPNGPSKTGRNGGKVCARSASQAPSTTHPVCTTQLLIHYLVNPCKSTLFGRSIGKPSTRSHTNWFNGPNALEAPKITVKNKVSFNP